MNLSTSTTPRPKYYGPDITETELILMIAIPCASLVLCCCICACCCVKCTQYRNRALKRMGNPWGLGQQSNGPPLHTVHSTTPMHNFATSNHYMDIHQLAIKNKKDYWELPSKNLVVHESIVLGHGAFASVYKGTITGKVPLLKAQPGIGLVLEHRAEGDYEAAVKRLPPHADNQNRMDFFHEIEFMKKLGYHVHIISMLGCVSDPIEPMIVVELCENGDLLKYVRSAREKIEANTGTLEDFSLRTKDLVSIAWQISDGMSYINSKGFIHRDLAARNILLSKNMVAKVSDFGLCRYVDSSLYTAKGGKLPIKWMAIESLKFYEYTVKTDVWAFGVTLFELFSLGDGPYHSIQPLEMLKYLEDGNRLPQPARCPNEIYSLMLRCWNGNKELRPIFDEIKAELALLLNLSDEHYGYLEVESEIRDNVRNMKLAIKETIKSDGSNQLPSPLKSPDISSTIDFRL